MAELPGIVAGFKKAAANAKAGFGHERHVQNAKRLLFKIAGAGIGLEQVGFGCLHPGINLRGPV